MSVDVNIRSSPRTRVNGMTTGDAGSPSSRRDIHDAARTAIIRSHEAVPSLRHAGLAPSRENPRSGRLAVADAPRHGLHRAFGIEHEHLAERGARLVELARHGKRRGERS